eukprot:6875537-Pyramimonas_sp.AAC.1
MAITLQNWWRLWLETKSSDVTAVLTTMVCRALSVCGPRGTCMHGGRVVAVTGDGGVVAAAACVETRCARCASALSSSS